MFTKTESDLLTAIKLLKEKIPCLEFSKKKKADLLLLDLADLVKLNAFERYEKAPSVEEAVKRMVKAYNPEAQNIQFKVEFTTPQKQFIGELNQEGGGTVLSNKAKKALEEDDYEEEDDDDDSSF